MKKILAWLMILVLMLPAALAAEAPFTGYESNFTKNLDGWYARGEGVQLVTRGNMLDVSGRSASWHSPGRDFNLVNGSRYRFSLSVRQNEAEEAGFLFSMAHSKDGVETYENLASVTAKKQEWTAISGEFIAGAYDTYTLYVETKDLPELKFTIRDVKVEPMGIVYDMTLPSLSQLYAPYFDFGCAVAQGQVMDAKRMNFYGYQFGIMTHENELKPDSVLDLNASRKLAKEDDTAVAVRFTAAKPLLDFCKKNSIKVHGHVLVWHSQTPDAFFRVGYQANGAYVSREVMLARLDNYIRQIMEYMETNYPGVVVSWDVVNEAVSDNSSALRTSNWTRVVGQDFVNRAFEIARKYAPEGTKLYYNDYSTPYEPKLTGICNLLDSLVADGNIDGYGFQAHYGASTPTLSAIRKAMEKIAGKGLRLRVSELDITIPSNSDVNLRIQAMRYSSLMELFLEFADVLDAVQVWGVTDDRSWKSSEYPLLFDNRVRPKPAFHAVVEAVPGEK